jgi:hypothetical protein
MSAVTGIDDNGVEISSGLKTARKPKCLGRLAT